MSNEQVTLLAGQRQRFESSKAAQACNDWLRLGPGRSLPLLLESYSQSNQKEPPTRSMGTLKGWSHRYKWMERGEEYDARIEAEKNARAREILESGLSLPHERVVKLKILADFLEKQLYEQGEEGVFHNVWLPDVKQIGSGDNVERVDIERFNSAIISEFRSVLDDLAKETGGRIRVTSGTNKVVNVDVAILTDEQLERIARGEDPIHVLATPGQS